MLEEGIPLPWLCVVTDDVIGLRSMQEASQNGRGDFECHIAISHKLFSENERIITKKQNSRKVPFYYRNFSEEDLAQTIGQN